MEKPEATYFCNKCGYLGPTSEHTGCDYFACTSLVQQWADHLEADNARLKEENKALAGGFKRDLAHKLQQQTAKNKRLKEQLAAAQADAKRYRWLREACGYVEDGSSTSVTICQDDATRDWIVRIGPVGSKHWGSGRSLGAAIDDAITKEKS